MKFFTSMTLFAGLLSAASAITTDIEERDETVEEIKAGCAAGVHIVSLGGQGTTDGDMGYLSTLVYNITGRIKHSDIHQIGYPEGWLGPQDIPWAIPRLHKHLHAYAKGCPHTPIVLASYSVGAAVTMDTLCGSATTGADSLPSHFRHNIIANVVYGDLTFVPHKSYNHGTCKKKPGLVPRQFPGKCFPFGKHTRSYCDRGDVNCCSGDKPNVHFEYPQKFDIKATDWVVRRHRHHRRVNEHHHHHHHHHGKHHHKKHHHGKHHHGKHHKHH